MPTNSRPMTPGEVADLFGVSVLTVGTWADSGKLPSFRTLGNQRRFHREDVEALLITSGHTHPEDQAS